ncbi:MAG: NmrA family NAD(P)-binding protein [Alphaproteobacteria bacterium]|jgi:nucleoside-diphosphate-sugar epimerase|nr:NmrA family NAD(P)-binding protein [Alphaproteobacteria bacterium]
MPTVLVLGATGRIGRHATEAFADAGWTVRPYTRGTDMTKAAMGADVIVNGLNPPAYHNWAQLIPQITRQVIDAAQAGDATVILPGNVYNFGDTPGTWSETTPQRPVSRKGRIRKEMEAAYRAADIRTIVLRAGSFIDPAGQGDAMAELHMRSIRAGKLTAAGDPDCLHTFCYLPDWGRAAVMLAERRAQLGRFEDIPFPGHAFTIRDLQVMLEAETGRTYRITSFPWMMLRLAAPFWELARELLEMRYLWNTDHRLSDEKLALHLPDFRASDMRTAMLAGLPDDIHPDKAVRPGREPVQT